MKKKILNGIEDALCLFVVFMFIPFVYMLKTLVFTFKTIINIFILINKKINKF